MRSVRLIGAVAIARPSASPVRRAPSPGFGAFFAWDPPLGRNSPARFVLAFAEQDRDGLVHRDAFGALADEDLAERAFLDRLDLHRRLVRLDLGHDVAGRDRIAFLDQPLGELALFHGGRQRGHQDRYGHGGIRSDLWLVIGCERCGCQR